MKKKRIWLLSILQLLAAHVLAQTVIDSKGTKLTIDASKWSASGNDIFNKNTGGVGVGTTGVPNSSAALEVQSTSKGVLIPRVTLSAIDQYAPLLAHVAGMIVYNTATSGTAPTNVSPGFYYNNGSKWVRVADASNGDLTKDAWIDDNPTAMVKLGTQSDGSTTRPLGTEFVIKDNISGTIGTPGSGIVGIGTANPAWQLDVQGPSAIGQFKRITNSVYNNSPGFLFTRTRGTVGSEADIANGDFLGKVQFRGQIGGADTDYATFSYIANNTTAEDGRFAFFNGSGGSGKTEMMTINTNTGNVGIGNPTPDVRLSVQDNSVDQYLKVAKFMAPNNTTVGNNTMLRLGVAETTNNSAEIRFNYNGPGATNNRLDFGLFGSATTPPVSILGSGNMGIGTNNPTEKLQVTGTVAATNYTATTQNITGAWNLDLGANANWTLAGGANTLTISNAKAGMYGFVKLVNSGTSTITLPASSKVINGGGPIPLTQTAGGVDILTFYYDGTTYWWTYGNNYN